jgi:hypothetical protein
MNHIKFEWDNAYDVYSAEALNVVMCDREGDIEATCEADGLHFRSEGDLQPIMDVCSEYELNVTVLELNKDVILTVIKRSAI